MKTKIRSCSKVRRGGRRPAVTSRWRALGRATAVAVVLGVAGVAYAARLTTMAAPAMFGESGSSGGLASPAAEHARRADTAAKAAGSGARTGSPQTARASASGASTATAASGQVGGGSSASQTGAGAAGAGAGRPAAVTAAASGNSPVTPPAGNYTYPLHTGIRTTYFYAGEPATADNGYIQNVSSAWQTDWASHYGGTDDPNNRCGYAPCAFIPRENPFYFALPFSDYTSTGPVSDLGMVYWYKPPFVDGQSILKNRWIQITAAPDGVSKTVYAQWEDVGPFNEHDSPYVFGSSAPAYAQAGLDVSPAVRDYLGQNFKTVGSTTASWRFVEYSEVPDGPWKTTVTTSGPDWR